MTREDAVRPERCPTKAEYERVLEKLRDCPRSIHSEYRTALTRAQMPQRDYERERSPRDLDRLAEASEQLRNQSRAYSHDRGLDLGR